MTGYLAAMAQKTTAQRSDMTPDRFEFVVKNYLSDATPAIPQMNGRVLAVWGAEDLNVDAGRIPAVISHF